jgi:hypothetical protein
MASDMDYCTNIIPYPVIDGKTYTIKQTFAGENDGSYYELISFTGGRLLGDFWTFPDSCLDNGDGIHFALGWGREGNVVWTGITPGGTAWTNFSVSYMYNAVSV